MAVLQLSAQPLFLTSLGAPPLPWPRWIAAFQTYLAALDPDGTEVAAEAIVIHYLGTKVQLVFSQLTADTSTFKNVVSALENYFGPKKSTMIELHKFHQHCQGNGTPVKHYVASLL